MESILAQGLPNGYSHNLKLKGIMFESYCKLTGNREKSTNLSNFKDFDFKLL